MGGSDDLENLATLTAREHYVCHQLLVKIYPNHQGLIKAANMMCVGNFRNNRLYEWLRIKHSKSMSISQSGSGNSQYGSRWVYKINSDERRKIKDNDTIPNGFLLGKNKHCLDNNCNELVMVGSKRKYCNKCESDNIKNNRKTRNIKIAENVKKYNIERTIELFDIYKKIVLYFYTKVRK